MAAQSLSDPSRGMENSGPPVSGQSGLRLCTPRLRDLRKSVRLAFISDIHANLQAFQAVLADIEKQQAAEIYSLGDNIGYGPQPEEVTELLRERNIASIMGNHEYALLSPNYYKSLNPSARKSISITRELISDRHPALYRFAAALPDRPWLPMRPRLPARFHRPLSLCPLG